jgi:hypothetical protein
MFTSGIILDLLHLPLDSLMVEFESLFEESVSHLFLDRLGAIFLFGSEFTQVSPLVHGILLPTFVVDVTCPAHGVAA